MNGFHTIYSYLRQFEPGMLDYFRSPVETMLSLQDLAQAKAVAQGIAATTAPAPTLFHTNGVQTLLVLPEHLWELIIELAA